MTAISGTMSPSDSRCPPPFASAYSSRLCPTRAARRTSPVSRGPRSRAALRTPCGPARLTPIRSWQALPSPWHDRLGPTFVIMTRLQGSLHATACVLAPSKEAFDTPLSPPPLNDEPGPATGRSGAYPNGTCSRKPGPACRTQHANEPSPGTLAAPREPWDTRAGTTNPFGIILSRARIRGSGNGT